MRFQCVALYLVLWAGCAWGEIELKTVQEWGQTPLAFTYDAYQKNVIYALYTPDYAESFPISIHFLEELLIPTHNDIRYIHDRRINYNAFNYYREGDRLIYEITQEDPVRFECRFEAYSSENTIIIEGWIQNREPAIDWHGNGLICLRLRENADFYDLAGERTYVTNRFTGKRVSIFEACGAASPYFFLPTLDANSEYLPMIEKEDRYHRLRAQFETIPASNVGGNRGISMSCIHSDVRLDVLAGQTQDFRSEVRLMEIEPNATALWALYE